MLKFNLYSISWWKKSQNVEFYCVHVVWYFLFTQFWLFHLFGIYDLFHDFSQVINKGGVAYKNQPWHRECFTCTKCSKELAKEKFTSKDDQPYCAECYGELFAKKCCRCSKAITGKKKKKIRYIMIYFKVKILFCKLMVFGGGRCYSYSYIY